MRSTLGIAGAYTLTSQEFYIQQKGATMALSPHAAQ